MSAQRLLIDEADTFIKDNEEKQVFSIAGTHQERRLLIRTVEVCGEHEAKRFSTWPPQGYRHDTVARGYAPGPLHHRDHAAVKEERDG